ncbi:MULTISPECIES: MAE_28990/MAE_18760 family HEPN-like nuclease [unclassified Streptomyces]|uniref:MAE_28990/MAE_18760 family HEPN-like nuclease n=1 Tax=unclassified Streptomyces TaxID=2593676 RepID=UPI0037F9EFD4
MASIRTIENLESVLTEDLKWRTHEMQLWEQVASSCRSHQLPGILRGGIALVYAHWEGYVKEGTRAYLEYVSRKGLKVGQLRSEIAAVALRSKLGRGEASKSSSTHTEIVELLRSADALPAKIPYTSATIRTRSNLHFDTFADIMHSIGCDASRHEIYRSIIDKRLLRHRNDIAHGREEYVSLADWIDIRDRVLVILKDVRTQISNAATNEGYKRK